MENIIRTVTRCKKPECSIIVSSANVVDRDYGDSIVLIPDYFSTCPSTTELFNALLKRFHSEQLRSIAIGCICSYSYTLNHINISSYQSKVFMSIWGHLETLRKSSSRELSNWLSACIGQRSQEGYNLRFAAGNSMYNADLSVSTPTIRRRFNVSVKPVGTVFSQVYFGDADTLHDAMIADANALSTIKLVFNEPILKSDKIIRY